MEDKFARIALRKEGAFCAYGSLRDCHLVEGNFTTSSCWVYYLVLNSFLAFTFK